MSPFERFGEFFFKKTTPFLLFFFLAIPIGFSFVSIGARYLKLSQAEKNCEHARKQAIFAQKKAVEKERFLARYLDVTPNFCTQTLSSLSFLKAKREELHAIAKHPANPYREQVKKRLSSWEGTENRLQFTEKKLASTKEIREFEVKLDHPVQVDKEDLARIFSLIEGVSIGEFSPDPTSPQLLVQSFSLSQKEEGLYSIDLCLLKREFLP